VSSKTKPIKQHQVQQDSRGVTTRQQRLEVFSGPVPDPETLRRYEEIVAGSAKDIVRCFTKGMAVHRFRGRMDPILEFVGMLFAFGMVMGAGWVGYQLLLADKDSAGWTTLMGALSIVVIAFWKRKR
jgi:uncharacterized membrane protein